MMCCVCVLFAFFLILKGGDLLVESAIWLAQKAKIPPLVVGATIVAIATTFPELSVAFFSCLNNAEELALNTALGSMVCNFALVLGMSFLFVPSIINMQGLAKKAIMFIIAISLLFLLSLNGKLGIFDAIILLIVFALFLISNFLDAKHYTEPTNPLVSHSWTKTIIQFLISAFAIGYGANVLVANIENLSLVLGVNEGLLGVFVVAIGTNIPEFVTTLTSIKLKNSEIGVGNIFGASIIDATLLIATTIFSTKEKCLTLPNGIMMLTAPLLILITGVIMLPLLRNQKSNRIQGFFLVLLFFVYSILLTKIS